MSGASHTPGPWEIDAHGTVWHQGEVDECGVAQGYHAQCIVSDAFDRTGRRQSDEAMANLRLIAAAPELLEALERLRKATLDDRQDISAARSVAAAAIAKAHGQ